MTLTNQEITNWVNHLQKESDEAYEAAFALPMHDLIITADLLKLLSKNL